jgi:hypothetical protein
MTDCKPGGRTGPPADFNPCEMLSHLRVAYYELISGKARIHVGFNSRQSTYQKGDAPALLREIRTLEYMCSGNRGRAVRVGPYFSGPRRPFRY